MKTISPSICLFALVLILFLLAGCGEPKAPAQGANVLFILIDSLRSDHLKSYGYDRETAPFASSQADKGILFENLSAPCSWTKPSVASLFTGLFPTQHGVIKGNCRDTANNYVSDLLPEHLPKLAQFFKSSGYQTYAAIRNSHLKSFMGFSDGFDSFNQVHGTGDDIEREFKSWINGREQDSSPFFAYLHFLDVHSYTPPKEYKEFFGKPELEFFLKPEFMQFRKDVKEGRAVCSEKEANGIRMLYDCELRYLDDVMRNIADFLKQKGLWDNTLFILTSDHGEEFFEHNEFAHGHTMADNLLRVPLILRLPHDSIKNKRIKSPASLVDLPPTLFDLCNVPYNKNQFMGQSLMEQIVSENPSSKDRLLFGELIRENKFYGFFYTQSVRTLSYHFLRTYKPAKGALPKLKKLKKKSVFEASLRSSHPKLFVTDETLYSLKEDPGEFEDVIMENPKIRAKMDEALKTIDQALKTREASKGKEVILDAETIEDLKRTGYIR